MPAGLQQVLYSDHDVFVDLLCSRSQVVLADSPIAMATLSDDDIVITTFSKALATQSICSLFEIAKVTDKSSRRYVCGQTAITGAGSEPWHMTLGQDSRSGPIFNMISVVALRRSYDVLTHFVVYRRRFHC